MGCDYVHVSTAVPSPQQQTPVEANFQVPFATAIKEAVNIPVIAVDLIIEAEQAQSIITKQQADAVALARGILYDPH